jgi:phosphoglycerate dehydrogenase-like enzyme
MTILVLARPGAPHLQALQSLPAQVKFGLLPSDFDAADVEKADIVVNGSHSGETLAALWPRLSSLRWVHSLSAGVESLVFPALRESAVPLTNARGVYKRSLGEWTILAMLFFAKDVRRLLRQQHESKWEQFECQMLEGAAVAIIGYGEIGRDVAQRAKAFGMKVIATRRRADQPGDGIADEILPDSANAEVMSRADYVVLCSPLTPATKGMIGDAQFAAMRRSAVFINIGRGAVVDERALIDVLAERRILGAALDVFAEEPLPPSHPFWRMDNLLLSPHSADHTATWLHESTGFFIENFERFQAGEPLQNVVDKEAGY